MQLRVLKVVRDVTFSVWEALTFHRSTKCQRDNPGVLVNRPLDDPEALRMCISRFNSLTSAGGDKMLKMYCRDMVLEVRTKTKPPTTYSNSNFNH